MGSRINLTIDGTEYELLPIGKILPESECSIFLDGHWYTKKAIQRDIPKDWRIISFKNIKSGVIDNIEHRPVNISWWRDDKDWKIESVRRISDNEVFQIGDEICHRVHDTRPFVITSFYITDKNEMGCMGKSSFASVNYFIENWVKVKPKPKVPLFTSEDGVEIFKGDVYWFVAVKEGCIDMYKLRKCPSANSPQLDGYYKMFSTEEKAKEYIWQNQPKLVSYKEIEQILLKDYCTEASFPLLKQLFKSKINT